MDTLVSKLLFTLHLDVALDRTQNIGQAGDLKRVIVPIDGGSFEGEKLRGTVLPDGADWLTVQSDGSWNVDVRVTLKTDDEALIYMRYSGVLIPKPEMLERFNKREILPYDAYYARTTPRFETSAPKYRWLNGVIAVANGIRLEKGPKYNVFEIL
jgi:hypothetical protein